MASLEKPLPQNLDAERSVLGAILLDNSKLAVAVEKLKSSDFDSKQHRLIFAEMLAMRDAGLKIDLVTLSDELHKKGKLEDAGGPGGAYIAQLVDGVPRVSHMDQYAEIVREKAQRRTIIHLTHSIQQKALDSIDTTEELVASLRETLAAVTPVNGGNGNGARYSYSTAEFLSTEFPTPDYLIPGLVARGSSGMFFSKPHRLKSWLLMALAYSATREGKILGGKIELAKPVRTLLCSIEDPPSRVKERMNMLLASPAYQQADSNLVRLITRDKVPGFFLPDPKWHAILVKEILEHKADHVILDVLRKILKPGMDINKPSDSGDIVRELEALHDETGATITISHHQKKGDSDMMDSASGSYNIVSWSKILVRLDNKVEEKQPREATMVDIEVDDAWGSSMEPMRVILDAGAYDPLRFEGQEEGSTVIAAKYKLGPEWTLRDLAEASDTSKTTAWRRLQRWRDTGVAEKLQTSKSGRHGGMARFRFISNETPQP